jgi:hypothetical protein
VVRTMAHEIEQEHDLSMWRREALKLVGLGVHFGWPVGDTNVHSQHAFWTCHANWHLDAQNASCALDST